MSGRRVSTPRAGALARRAEALAARLPPLLVEAEQVAASVAPGVHGRRRVGSGESFWQFRPFVSGDPVARIDWRQSAKSGRTAPQGWFVRETEWEAAQTVYLWIDRSASMRWHSRAPAGTALPEKLARADLLALALASLLLRGGERVRLLGADVALSRGAHALDAIAEGLQRLPATDALPPALRAAPNARVVLFGDFLGPLEDIQTMMRRLATLRLRGQLVAIHDPAELDLPYEGRVRFEGVEQDGETLIPRVGAVREAYARRMEAQMEGLAHICAGTGFGLSRHRTDHAPHTALLALHEALG